MLTEICYVSNIVSQDGCSFYCECVCTFSHFPMLVSMPTFSTLHQTFIVFYIHVVFIYLERKKTVYYGGYYYALKRPLYCVYDSSSMFSPWHDRHFSFSVISLNL